MIILKKESKEAGYTIIIVRKVKIALQFYKT